MGCIAVSPACDECSQQWLCRTYGPSKWPQCDHAQTLVQCAASVIGSISGGKIFSAWLSRSESWEVKRVPKTSRHSRSATRGVDGGGLVRCLEKSQRIAGSLVGLALHVPRRGGLAGIHRGIAHAALVLYLVKAFHNPVQAAWLFAWERPACTPGTLTWAQTNSAFKQGAGSDQHSEPHASPVCRRSTSTCRLAERKHLPPPRPRHAW